MPKIPGASFYTELPVTIQFNIELTVPVFITEGCDMEASLRKQINNELSLSIKELSETLDKVLT